MAIKGALAKEEVTAKILGIFPDAFRYDKELRIPMVENGETVQIKVTLACAKINVSPDSANELPTAQPTVAAPSKEWNFDDPEPKQEVAPPPQPTAEEKENIANMLKQLGF